MSQFSFRERWEAIDLASRAALSCAFNAGDKKGADEMRWAARAQKAALFDAIDPNDELKCSAIAVCDEVGLIVQAIGSKDARLNKHEAAALADALAVSDATTFKALRSLAKSATTALKEARRRKDAASLTRMEALKCAVQSAIDDGVDYWIGQQRRSVLSGVETIEDRLARAWTLDATPEDIALAASMKGIH